jgi:hypothetical protein
MAQQQQPQQQSEIRYLTPPTVDVKRKKYCRFKKVVSSISTIRILSSSRSF